MIMQKKILTICLFILLTGSLFSQISKFGIIPKEHWEINKCDFDTISEAIIIFDYGKILVAGNERNNRIDANCNLTTEYFSLYYERHIRIKLLNEINNGSNIHSFTLRSIDKKKDRLVFFKGIIIHDGNDAETKIKLKEKDLIKEVNKDGSCLITLKLPPISKGSIVDIVYTIVSDIFTETPEWRFSNNYPTLYSEINFSIPDFFVNQIKCNLLNKLEHESRKEKEEKFVSFQLPLEYWENYSIYNYDRIIEKYFLANIPSLNNLVEFNLKYIFTAVNCHSVYCSKKVFNSNRK